MNFQKLLDFLRALGQAVVFTLAYLGGRRSVMKEIEAETAKRALEEATRVMNEREGVKQKYENLKSAVPDSWPSAQRLRKTGSD